MKEIDEDALAEAYERGLACERAGDHEGAAAAFREALRLDPADRGGVSVRLASLGAGPPPLRAPEAYVAMLFDQHAEAFDTMLVEQLGYDTPMDLRRALTDRGLTRFGRMLDLGCGTGLAGESLSDYAQHITGVDLSEGMLEVAHDKEVYDDLYVGDAEGFLEVSDEQWDLITATDVLPYLGAVEALFRGAAQRLSQGGVFAFSTETLPEAAFAGSDWMVGPKQRYAHDPGYLGRALKAAGFAGVEMEEIVVRYDEGQPIAGHLVIARKPDA